MAVAAPPRRRAKAKSPVTAYAMQVVAGDIVAGRLVRLACERHLRDLKDGAERGIWFDEEAAQRAINFFLLLRHTKGEWAGQPFKLALWQAFTVGSVFGWKKDDGTRRFATSYEEVARKNGKSTKLAGLGLLLSFFDDEPGAEVYAAATKRDQAKIVWGEARRMVKASPGLARRIQVLVANLNNEETASKFEPLGADADSTDGLNIHGGLVDELHAHKTRAMWDVLETATGARRQPLILVITTAGFDQNSICRELHDYATQVLEGVIDDDTLFAYIATIDEDDDWRDPACWPKANPNLGVSVKVADLERDCERAKHMPGKQNSFLRLRLCVWTQQVGRWIDIALWKENAEDEDGQLLKVVEADLKGCLCYGGLDLGAVDDLTAWVMVFPYEDDEEEIDVLARFWCPEGKLRDTHNRYRAQYIEWARDGWLQVTPGEAIDYAFVEKQILEDARTFGLVDMAVDRLFQAHQLAMKLADEMGEDRVAGMGQGFLSMAMPMKEFQRRLLIRKIGHGGNPILGWMANNVAVTENPAGDFKMDKSKSQGKIDGMVALLMALDRSMRHEDKRSVYEDRGLLTV